MRHLRSKKECLKDNLEKFRLAKLVKEAQKECDELNSSNRFVVYRVVKTKFGCMIAADPKLTLERALLSTE